MNKSLKWFLIIFILVSLALTNIVVANTSIETEVITLKSDKSSEILLDKVEVKYFSDGTVIISTKGTRKLGSPAVYFEVEVDLENKTYRTRTLPIPLDMINTTESSISSFDNIELQSYLGTFTADVRIHTRDPLSADLAITTNVLSWNAYTGSVSRNYHRYNYWAANPSIFGTHWFVDWSSGTYPWIEGLNIYSENEAQYYNYDFMDPNLPTYANHYILIRGADNGTYSYWADAIHSGEYSGLLHYRVFTDYRREN